MRLRRVAAPVDPAAPVSTCIIRIPAKRTGMYGMLSQSWIGQSMAARQDDAVSHDPVREAPSRLTQYSQFHE